MMVINLTRQPAEVVVYDSDCGSWELMVAPWGDRELPQGPGYVYLIEEGDDRAPARGCEFLHSGQVRGWLGQGGIHFKK